MQTCSHIKADGALCRAIPMKNKTRCYFHQQAQARQRQLKNNPTLTMPVIEDVPSIQLALMDVVNRLAQGTIEARNAGLILYALQIASSNLRTGRFTSKGWQDYQSKNAQLVTTEAVEERSQTASEVLVQMLTARREECMAQGPDPDLQREHKITFINACAEKPLDKPLSFRAQRRTHIHTRSLSTSHPGEAQRRRIPSASRLPAASQVTWPERSLPSNR